MGKRTFARTLLSTSLVLILITQWLPAAPPAMADEPEPAPAPEIGQTAEVPPPLPDRFADPIPAKVDEDGFRNLEEAYPAPDPAADPEAAVDDLTPLPKAGGETFDVFGTGPDNDPHVAVVYPEQVNYESAAGKWKDLTFLLEADGYGWSGQTTTSLVRFPASLGTLNEGQPLPEPGAVRAEFEAGSLAIAPEAEVIAGEADETSVTYRSVYPSTDYNYSLAVGGYKELLILQDKQAPSSFTYTIRAEGLTLRPETTGEISIISGAEVIGVLPAPIAYDASAVIRQSVGTYGLQDLGSGSYSLTLQIDPSFLANATFPVSIDPGTATKNPSRDGYVDSGSPSTSFESSIYLKVGSGKRSYLKFDTTNLQRADRLVYFADLYVNPSSGSPSVDAKKVNDSWPSSLTWNNKPDVGQVVDTRSGPSGGWYHFRVEGIYQDYLDNTIGVDRGVALVSNGNGTFASSEGTNKPQLYLMWNDLPNKPSPQYPAAGTVVDTPSPVLKVSGKPNDNNGDPVLIQFQVSDDPDCSDLVAHPVGPNPADCQYSGGFLKWESPWVDDTSLPVPSGVLTDGQKFYWRARSLDVCNDDTNAPCALRDGNGDMHDPNASDPREITSIARRYGTDERWAMWSQALGNDMNLKVNEATGNVYLDVPLDVVKTPTDELKIALSYNSQRAIYEPTNDFGMGKGWDIGVGPASDSAALPMKIVKDANFPDSGVKIRYHDGGYGYFSHLDGHAFAGGVGSGTLHQNNNDTWRLRTQEGGTYTFDDKGRLSNARPVTQSDASGSTKTLQYNFNNDPGKEDQLMTVTDSLGRVISFNWAGTANLQSITTWDNRTWTLGYANGQLGSITTPAGEQMHFNYTTYGSVSLLSEVRDGATPLSSPGWGITYAAQSGGGVTWYMVTAIAPPFVNGETSGAQNQGKAWRFGYASQNWAGSYQYTYACDPRNTSGVCSPGYSTNITALDFNSAGLPLRIAGPAYGTYVPTTTMAWDTNNNMICKREPAANVIEELNGADCSDPLKTNSKYSTVYAYGAKAPYRMASITHAVPTLGGTRRMKETFDYDGGPTPGSDWQGLWTEYFGNANMNGIPRAEGTWDEMNKDWGGGKPSQIGSDDNWTMRLNGYLDVPDSGNYKFKVYSNDGANVIINSKTIAACFGQTQNANDFNCGTNNIAERRMDAGLKPITIEYSELTGNASFNLQWNGGHGTNYTKVPGNRLSPNMGILTTKTLKEVDVDGTSNPSTIRTMTYAYGGGPSKEANDLAKERELPYSQTITAGGLSRTTSFTYDPDYGRALTVTGPNGGTTTNTYTDDATGKKTCLTHSVGPTGAVSDFVCNQAGDVTQATTTIRAVDNQLAQSRVSTTAYDNLGRVTQIDGANGAQTTTAYDSAGRVRKVKTVIDANTVSWSWFTYWSTGQVKDEYLGGASDPDQGGTTQTHVYHEYDSAGNEVMTRDARNQVSYKTYDASNRLASATSPLSLVTSTAYEVSWSGTVLTNKMTVTAPHAVGETGVQQVTNYDLAGRKSSEYSSANSTMPTTYSYDARGNVLEIAQQVVGGDIKTTSTYNGFDQVDTKKTEKLDGTWATTQYTYDSAGRLQKTDGPRTDVNDWVEYQYDQADRLTRASLTGFPTPANFDFTYDDVGERTKAVAPLESGTMVRKWTYDLNGRVSTEVADNHTTTNGYDAAGRLTSATISQGVSSITRSFTYDRLGHQLTRSAIATTGSGIADTPSATFVYDAAGNMTSASEGGNSVAMEYDADARLCAVTIGTADGSCATGQTIYGFDPARGWLTSVVDPAGTTTLGYDNAKGQITTVDDPLASSGVTTYTYDPAGRLSGRTDPAGATWARTYEANTGRLDTQTITKGGKTLGFFDLGYDVAGNVTSRVENVLDATNPSANLAGSGTWTYDYDAANRMKWSQDPSAVRTTYGYDGAGNRTTLQVGSGTIQSTTYSSAGLPTATGSTTFDHDVAGDLTKIDAPATDRAFAYDGLARLTASCAATAVTPGCAGRIDYVYDALSRTTSRTDAVGSDAFAYRGLGEDPAAIASLKIAQGPYGPLAQGSAGSASFYLKDLHSDIVGLYNSSTGNSGSKLYSPWGEKAASTGAASDLGFQSDYTDPDTGQVDMGTRYYEPTMGRFTTQDMLFGEMTNPNSLNQYVYGIDSPATMWDPTGMCNNKIGITQCATTENEPKNQGTGGGSGGGNNNGGNETTATSGASGSTSATGNSSPVREKEPPIMAYVAMIGTVVTGGYSGANIPEGWDYVAPTADGKGGIWRQGESGEAGPGGSNTTRIYPRGTRVGRNDYPKGRQEWAETGDDWDPADPKAGWEPKDLETGEELDPESEEAHTVGRGYQELEDPPQAEFSDSSPHFNPDGSPVICACATDEEIQEWREHQVPGFGPIMSPDVRIPMFAPAGAPVPVFA